MRFENKNVQRSSAITINTIISNRIDKSCCVKCNKNWNLARCLIDTSQSLYSSILIIRYDIYKFERGDSFSEE